MARNVIIISIMLLFLLLGSLMSGAKAVTYQVGVSKGDVFYYDFSEGDDMGRDIADHSSSKLEITNVASPIVSFTITNYNSTGIVSSWSGYFNVETGDPNYHYPQILSSNLEVGDKPFTQSFDSISKTVMWTYTSGTRETNYYHVDLGIASYDVYFDRKTGVVVQFTMGDSSYSGQSNLRNSTVFRDLTVLPSPSPTYSPTPTPTATPSPTPTSSPSPTPPNDTFNNANQIFPIAAISIIGLLIAIIIILVYSGRRNRRKLVQ
jgi:hypothetical protein